MGGSGQVEVKEMCVITGKYMLVTLQVLIYNFFLFARVIGTRRQIVWVYS